jgi:hypothetical protein
VQGAFIVKLRPYRQSNYIRNGAVRSIFRTKRSIHPIEIIFDADISKYAQFFAVHLKFYYKLYFGSLSANFRLAKLYYCAIGGFAQKAGHRLKVFYQTPVKVGTSVAEKSERRAVFSDQLQIKIRDQNAAFFRAILNDQIAAFVGDEAVAVEVHRSLGPDAVARHHWNDIADRMADHRAPP